MILTYPTAFLRGLPWIEKRFEIDASRSRRVSFNTFLHYSIARLGMSYEEERTTALRKALTLRQCSRMLAVLVIFRVLVTRCFALHVYPRAFKAYTA
jgi:hypothetical protein